MSPKRANHGALDPHPVSDGPRLRSVSDAPVRTTPLERIDLTALRSRSETYNFQSPTNQLDAQLSSRLGRKWKLKWKLLAHEGKTSPDLPQQGGNLQYTSSTLKRKRREIRESSLMLSSKPKPPPIMPSKTIHQTETINNPSQQQRDTTEWSLPFLPENEIDDVKVRHSVRGTTRRKRSRGVLGRSASLPTELHQEWPSRLDQEFWRAGFVQSRVRRLEEDLATVRPDSWSFFWSEGESQSLCSLELGRIVPDGDDYRIAYLSSAGTSVESSLEYVGGGVDVRVTACSTLDRRSLPPRSEDWDMSLSSTDNRVSPSDDEDEFEYFLPEDSFDPSAHALKSFYQYECKNDSGISEDIEAGGIKDPSDKDADISSNPLKEKTSHNTPKDSTEDSVTECSFVPSGTDREDKEEFDKDTSNSDGTNASLCFENAIPDKASHEVELETSNMTSDSTEDFMNPGSEEVEDTRYVCKDTSNSEIIPTSSPEKAGESRNKSELDNSNKAIDSSEDYMVRSDFNASSKGEVPGDVFKNTCNLDIITTSSPEKAEESCCKSELDTSKKTVNSSEDSVVRSDLVTSSESEVPENILKETFSYEITESLKPEKVIDDRELYLDRMRNTSSNNEYSDNSNDDTNPDDSIKFSSVHIKSIDSDVLSNSSESASFESLHYSPTENKCNDGLHCDETGTSSPFIYEEVKMKESLISMESENNEISLDISKRNNSEDGEGAAVLPDDKLSMKEIPNDREPIESKKSNREIISVKISCKGGKTVSNNKSKILQEKNDECLSLASRDISFELNEWKGVSLKSTSDAISDRNTSEETEENNFADFSKDFYHKKLRNLHTEAKIPEDMRVDDAPPPKETEEEKTSGFTKLKSPIKICKRSDSFNKKNLCCIKDGNWSKKYEATTATSDGPLVELVVYEPLSTPFAAIYAISCGRYSSRESHFPPENVRADSPKESSTSKNSNDITLLLDKQKPENLERMGMNGFFSDLSLPTRPWSHSTMLKGSDEKFGFNINVSIESVKPLINTNSLITGLLKINRIDIDSILSRPKIAPILGVSLKYIPLPCHIRSFKSQKGEEKHENGGGGSVNKTEFLTEPRKLKCLKYVSAERKTLFQSLPQNDEGQIHLNYFSSAKPKSIIDIDSFYLTDSKEHRYDQIISKGIRKLISGGIQGRIINFSPTPFVTTIIPSCRGEYRLQKTQMLEILLTNDENDISNEKKKRIAICFLPRNQNSAGSETEVPKNQVTSAAAESRLAEETQRHAATSQPRRAAFAEYFRQNSIDSRGGKERATAVVVDLDYLSRCCGSIDRSFQQHVELDGPTQALLISILRRSAMADEDPRSFGKVVRTQGKNISKLMKLFDNGESPKQPHKTPKSVCVSDESASVDFPHDASPLDNVNGVISFPLDTQNANTELGNGESDSTGELSQIPYCRKVAKKGLWDNVDISGKSNGVWESGDNRNGSVDTVSSYEASTAELNDLIATSRAELSKKSPSVSDRSNLEDYFTSFESSPTRKCDSFDLSEYSPIPNGSQFPFNNEVFDPPAMYDCDVNEMNFDEEDPVISDTSSEEDLRCHPAMINTNYLPAYALHTIIEESCEESERDSRTATPTNNTAASKLERYFSWDIINDADLRKKQDDESTIYSDSLSEHSGSLVGEDPKEIDPTHLASSRLEKYFTSGLVDDQNYFYPDDAEFVDDAPVSDFEEDSIHLKISRSALLSSLETKPSSLCEEEGVVNCKESESSINEESKTVDDVPDAVLSLNTNAKSDVCDKESVPGEISCQEENKSLVNEEERIPNPEVCDSVVSESIINTQKDAKLETNSSQTVPPVELEDPPVPSATVLKISPKNSPVTVRLNSQDDHTNLQKSVVKKDHLANDIQGIIKKLLSHFSEEGSESLRKNFETDYISAWQLLETEIERLLQSIPSHTIDNNSCNSSTIDSNNSDYGSDTIESLDCMTDDDDTADPKIRLNSKCPPPLEFLGSSYGTDLSSFNISDETLSIWKRLIHSLQKDNAVLSENKLCDPTAEARLYIKDQIVTLMHTVTVHDAIPEVEKEEICSDHSKTVMESLGEENFHSEEINEAFNVNLSSSNIRAHLPIEDTLVESKTESSSDEGISVGSTENVHSKTDAPSTKHEDSVDGLTKDLLSPVVEESFKVVCNLSSKSGEQDSVDMAVKTSPSPKNKIIELKQGKKESDIKFSVFVDIELDEDSETVTKQKIHSEIQNETSTASSSKSSDVSEKTSDSLFVSSKDLDVQEPGTSKSPRDTGYFSFKSSDDSMLNTSTPSAELVDVPNFKSLKRTVKKFQISNTLSKSTNNILQNFSVPDTQFSTLQLKPKKVKEASASSRQFSSLFSPSAMLKRFTGGKSNEASAPESSIPPKYLKKYARSISVDNESLFGAASMPHLNNLRPGDSYSELGLYNDRTQDSCLTLDEDTDPKKYFSGSQSVLSLGAHSASMTSVYSASGCHYGYVTVTGDVLFGLNYNQKSQMMEVFVKQCRNLAATDAKHNRSNPYVKVYLLPDKTRSGKRKTKTKKNTLNPVFNELLRFPVGKNELESRTLWLSVWNSDLFGRNDFLGEISLPLGYRLLDSPTLRWYPLQERVESLTSPLNYKGELFLALKYVPRDLSLESRFRSAPVISQRGALHVLVKEARNISGNRSSGTLDAFCKSYLLPDKSKSSKQKTPVVKKSGHPKWYYTVIYEDLSMDELKERSLELTVWDHDKLTSNEFMGGIRLNIGTGLYHGVPVDWMDSRRDESALWQTMLESPNMWVDGCLPLRPTMQFHNS